MWIFNKKIRYAVRSPEWPAVRKAHIKKQPCCMACGSCKKPEVHHIVPVHLDPSKELDPDNLITLCDKYCHFVFGHFMNYKSWNINIIEDSRRYLESKSNRPYKDD
jgi:hypothetical protein